MSTSKKKPAAKAKPAKKSAILPPPEGWQIVSKNDPRLKKLPCQPIGWTGKTWAFDPIAKRGDSIPDDSLELFLFALPIAQPAAEPAPPMIRLRLPSEKPTREDGDDNGDIVVFCTHGEFEPRQWKSKFGEGDVAWLPGRLPEGLLPKPPTQDELWQQEFSEWWTNTGHTDHNGLIAEAAWSGFLAAKKGGQQP